MILSLSQNLLTPMWHNTALFSAQSGTTFNKAFTTPKLWGRWVESAVGAYLLNQADEYDYKLYYWREREDEVDFIIEYNKQCIAIEVKSGRRTTNEGLGVFRDRFHPKQSFVVGSGGVPIEEFLRWDIGNLLEWHIVSAIMSSTPSLLNRSETYFWYSIGSFSDSPNSVRVCWYRWLYRYLIFQRAWPILALWMRMGGILYIDLCQRLKFQFGILENLFSSQIQKTVICHNCHWLSKGKYIK